MFAVFGSVAAFAVFGDAEDEPFSWVEVGVRAAFVAGVSLEAHENVGYAVHADCLVGEGFAGVAGFFAVMRVVDLDDEDLVLDPEGVDGGGGEGAIDAFVDGADFDVGGEITAFQLLDE